MFEQNYLTFLTFCTFVLITTANNGYTIELVSDSPIVRGGTINFSATVYYYGKLVTTENLKFKWIDEAIPQHSRSIETQNGSDSWSITYTASVYPAGSYLVQVDVARCVILDVICYEIGSVRKDFEITETLNGDLQLLEKNETRTDNFVSSKETITHLVDLKKSDFDYITSAPTVFTYWFVDCIYYGITTDFRFPFNYTTPDESHVVEALVMADFTPLPPTTTTAPSTTTTSTTTTKTTTTSTTTTTPKPTSTTKPTTTTTATTVKPIVTFAPLTPVPTTDSTTVPKPIAENTHIIKRSVSKTGTMSRIMVKVNGSLVPYNGTFPYVCNGTEAAKDSNKTYGYFYKKVDVKAPLSKVNVTGNNWIQPGDLLSLKITCSGSKTMQYCIQYRRGEYNVTGNETCFEYSSLDNCDFSIMRYLSFPKNTIVIIIKNEVSKVVTPVTVNIYKVNIQGQLSVIVVPVVFCLVAVVLIVFGVAYYIQNRSSFIVEVADFNFGQQYSDMEYKTFRERLRDSIVNAFSRGPSPSTSEVPVWPPGQKYGSMT